MAKQDIYVDLDLNRNELKNAVFENLAESPETAKPGQLFYDSAASKFRGRIGEEWIDIIDRDQLEAVISLLPVPMQFKGTLGTGGTYTAQTLPAASSENQGWTLKVIEDGIYQGVQAEVGDVLISNGEAWIRVPAGDEKQSDWNQTDATQPDYIKNKPELPIIHFALTDNGDDTYTVIPSMTAQQLLGELNNNEARVYATVSVDGYEALRTDQFLFDDSFIICTIHVFIPITGGGSTDLLIVCDDIQNNTWMGANILLKEKQSSVPDPASSGFADDFIDSISQDEDGVISVTKKGIAQLQDSSFETASYTYRQCPAEKDGTALIGSFLGNTLVWNQQMNITSSGTEIIRGVSFRRNGNGSISVYGSSDGTGTAAKTFSHSFINGHVYYIPTSKQTQQNVECSVNNNSSWNRYSTDIFTATTQNVVVVSSSNNNVITGEVLIWIELFDLTQMFGAGNEPSTVEEFEALYPLPYYDYNAGQLISNSMSGVKSVGFNQWDEIGRNGYYNSTTGAYTPPSGFTTNHYCNSNPIRVLPNTEYAIKIPSGLTCVVLFYEETSYIGPSSIIITNGTFVTPSNCTFINFYVGSYGTTYNHDICINLSNPTLNGTYKPYETWTLDIEKFTSQGIDIFPEGLNKVGQVYDEIEGKRAIKRIGSRAYTSGDESDSSVLTDLTTTLYPLTNPQIYTLDSEPLRIYQVRKGGTEQALSSLLSAPISYTVQYESTVKDEIEHIKEDKETVIVRFNHSNNIITSTYTPSQVAGMINSGKSILCIISDGTTTAYNDSLNILGTEIECIFTTPLFGYHQLFILGDIETDEWDYSELVLKTQQTPKQDPPSSGFSGDFIDSITQNENGEIAATKKKISLPVSDPIESTFIYRQSGAGELSGDSGTAWINKFYGNTVVWNQLASFNDNTLTPHGLSITIVDNVISISGTVDNTFPASQYYGFANLPSNTITGHYYYEKIDIDIWNVTNGEALIAYRGTAPQGMNGTNPSIILAASNSTNNVRLYTSIGTQINIQFRLQLIDLTKMFGAGNEPSSVSEFEAMYPLSYYSYNAGQLIGNSASGIETVGFNVWDEEWEVGSINSNTGETYSNNNSFRSSNFIEVLPNKNLYLTSNIISTNTGIVIIYYNANQERVGATSESTSAGISFTTPENCRYIKFRGYNGSRNFNNTPLGSTETICINISDPNKNGTYEPYENHTTNFNLSELTGKLGGQGSSVIVFGDGLNKVGSVYDEIVGKRAIKRIGIVDLGSLSWTREMGTTISTYYFRANLSVSAVNNGSSVRHDYLCPKYTLKATNDERYSGYMENLSVAVLAAYVNIRDDSYSDAISFKTAMNGVYLCYELGTYETYILDEEPRNDYPYNRLGTERRLPADTSSSILPPFSALIQYENYCGDTVNGVERKIKQLNLPVPEIADSGKLLGVDENGEYTLIQIVNAENIQY